MIFSKILDSSLVKTSKTLLPAILLLISPSVHASCNVEDCVRTLRRRLPGIDKLSPPPFPVREQRGPIQNFDAEKQKIQKELDTLDAQCKHKDSHIDYAFNKYRDLNEDYSRKIHEIKKKIRGLEEENRSLLRDDQSDSLDLVETVSKEIAGKRESNEETIEKLTEEMDRIRKLVEQNVELIKSYRLSKKTNEKHFQKKKEYLQKKLNEFPKLTGDWITLSEVEINHKENTARAKSEMSGITDLHVVLKDTDWEASGGNADLTFTWNSKRWEKQCCFNYPDIYDLNGMQYCMTMAHDGMEIQLDETRD